METFENSGKADLAKMGAKPVEHQRESNIFRGQRLTIEQVRAIGLAAKIGDHIQKRYPEIVE